LFVYICYCHWRSNYLLGMFRTPLISLSTPRLYGYTRISNVISCGLFVFSGLR
jgi:hypothetical protein